MSNKTLTLQQRASELLSAYGSSRRAATAIGIETGYFRRILGGAKIYPKEEVLRRMGLESEARFERLKRTPTPNCPE